MNAPELDDLLDQLEEARETGRTLAVEDVCADYPHLLEPLRERWKRLNRFDDRFGTRLESTEEVEKKLSVMPENMTGQRLIMQSELHIEGFHDRGGLGEVYRATDGELSRDMAVKLLRADRQLPANIEDFKRESQILGGMNHPGIVAIHGWGESIDGRPFYTMPFLDRGNLRSTAAKYHREHPTRVAEGNKEFRDLLYRLASVCKTIAYAHSRGIVHRDLKAENILLGKYGETLVIDWGCATRVDRHERFKVYGEQTLQIRRVDDSSSTRGLTLRYASPEQLHGRKPIGPESDIYSLGSVLYLLLTGESPLENVSDEQVRQQVLRGSIPSPESVKTGVPRALAAICRKAMALEPDDRYDTSLQMAEDLERYLSDESVTVCSDSLGLRVARVVRRNRTASLGLLSMLVVGSILLSLAFAGQSVFARRAEASAKERLRMAATLAANVGGFEINRRISLLEKEASSTRLIDALLAIADEPENRELWERPQNLLYEFRDELQAAGVDLESMFLTDARGTQLARAPKSSSVGKNFAYRHYFHGLREDLDPASSDYQQNPPPPAIGPVVSNAYVSTNQDSSGEFPIKTAFTVPIGTADREGNWRVLGRLGMSVKINDLAVFGRLAELSVEAVLVETRDYTWGSDTATGLVLDRIHSQGRYVTVPHHDVTTKADLQTEIDVKDAMLRLDSGAIDEVIAQTHSTDEACLIPSFNAPRINPARQDAACAKLRIPYRADIRSGWMVLLIESSGQP